MSSPFLLLPDIHFNYTSMSLLLRIFYYVYVSTAHRMLLYHFRCESDPHQGRHTGFYLRLCILLKPAVIEKGVHVQYT